MAYHQKIITGTEISGVVDITSVETLTAPEWAEWVRDHLHPAIPRGFFLPWTGSSDAPSYSIFGAVIPRMQVEAQRASCVGLDQCLGTAYAQNSGRGNGGYWIDGEESLSELFLLVGGLKSRVPSARSYFGNNLLLRFLDVLESRPRCDPSERSDHDAYERCLQALDSEYLDVPFWLQQLDLSNGVYLRTALSQVLHRPHSAVDDTLQLLRKVPNDSRVLEMIGSALFTVESSMIDALESRAVSLPLYVRTALSDAVSENRRLCAEPRS